MRQVQIAAAVAAAVTLSVPAPSLAQSGNPLSAIFSCDSPGGKQEGGAVLGGVVGGLVGNKVAKNERGLGTVVGAALGAAAGSYIGCRMQRSDQEKAELTTREALDDNRDSSWRNPETGASGDVRMVSTGRYDAPMSLSGLRLASGVELVDSYDGAGGRYRVRGATRLRGAPANSARTVGKLRSGDSIDALARVHGSNWLLAGRNGVGIGYIPDSAVRPVDAYAAAGPVCRTFDQTIRTQDGAPETQRHTACKSPTGEWVVQPR